MRIEVTGEAMIFRKEHEGRIFYSTSIGKKKQDGEWESAYIDVSLRKGVNLADKTKIEVVNGWLTFYKTKEGKPVWQIFISEFEQLSGIPSGFEEMKGFAALDDPDSVPF